MAKVQIQLHSIKDLNKSEINWKVYESNTKKESTELRCRLQATEAIYR